MTQQDEYQAKLERDHKQMREALELVWNLLSPTDEAVAVEQLRGHVQEVLTNLEVESASGKAASNERR
jgi:hypothetical protein